MPRLGDIYGRKRLIAADTVVYLVLYFAVLFAPNVYVLGAALTAQGFFNSCRMNIGMIYLDELMPKKSRTFIGTIMNIG